MDIIEGPLELQRGYIRDNTSGIEVGAAAESDNAPS